MDLEKELKSYPVLSSCLDEIVNACNKIWNNPLLPWFTKHDVSHSQEIIHLLGQILSPLEETPQMLNEHELFILLASAYLHDIGMQNLKVDNISIDKLTSNEYELIRKRHAEESHDIILKRLNIPIQRDDFYLPIIEDDYLPIIAKVSKGHATDFFEESIEYFKRTPANPQNRTVRAELLTALLMIADELDLHSKRASFFETGKFKLSDYSSVHWYKHHYVASVEVDKGTACLTLQFPEDANEYKDLIKELIETKLKTQLDKVRPILKESTEGLLHLNDIDIQTRTDGSGAKRRLPDGALKELKKILKEPEPIVSDIKKEEDIILHSIPRPSNIFTGRNDDLKRFKEALEQSNLISIEGLGGIGKTEFASKCIEKYTQQSKVVWFDCSPDTKLDSLIDYCGYSDVIKGENKTELAKYSGFLSLIERDGKIIFLDNYQDITDESFRNFFKFTERRLRKARFVLIAREHPPLGGIHILPVTLEGLKKYSVEYARKAINMYYSDVAVDDDSLQNICDTVDGHPLAINLAMQLLHYGETSREIIDKLVHSEDINKQLSHRLLDEIFNHPKSTEQEKEFLLNFSVFRNKVLSTAFKYISDDTDRVATLHKLMDKHMIMRYGNLYGAHPLVREFCYHRLENKEKLHLKAYEYLKAIRQERLDIMLEEEVFYHLLSGEQLQELASLISEKGEDFVLLGHTNFLKEMMDAIVKKGIESGVFCLYYGDIAQIKGEWDDATKYFEKSFSFPNVDEKTYAMAYIKYGEMLFRKGQIKESLGYFEKGADICKKINFRKGEARSLNDIGLVSYTRGDLSNAMSKHKESLKIREEIGDKEGIAISLNNIGLVFNTRGDLDGAMSKYKESLEISEEIGDKSGIANSLNNIGRVLNKRGDLDDAMSKVKESLKIHEETGDKSGISTSLNNIGLVFNTRGDLDGAMSKYKESLEISEEIGDKSGIADSLSNIGGVSDERGDLIDAMSKFKESLKIREEIGDKSGISTSLNNIGLVLRQRGDLDGAMSKYKESLKIIEEIGNKSEISTSLNNIGFVLKKRGDWDSAMSKYKESMKIREEIGDRQGIATTFYNIGTLCFENKDYYLALINLFKSMALSNQMGTRSKGAYSYISKIREIQGFKKFKNLAEETFDKLPEDLKPFIDMKEFTEDKTIHVTQEPGRNEPCPCGSGKKYKKCCGRS